MCANKMKARIFVMCAIFALFGCNKNNKYEDIFPERNYVDSSLANINVSAAQLTDMDGYFGSCLDDRCLQSNNKCNIDLSVKSQVCKPLWSDTKYQAGFALSVVIYGNELYYCDRAGCLICRDKNSGSVVFRRNLVNGKNVCKYCLSLDISTKFIILTSDCGDVVAFDVQKKDVAWQLHEDTVLRGGAAIVGNSVLVMRYDNTVVSYDIKNGKKMWAFDKLHSETAFANPGNFAVSGDRVICAYSSGECALLSVAHGDECWNEIVMALQAEAAIDLYGVLISKPVLYKSYAIVSNARGNTTAIDKNSGQVIWRNDVGIARNMCTCGDWIFAVDKNNNLVCMSIKSGKLKYRISVLDQMKNSIGLFAHNQKYMVQNYDKSDHFYLSNPIIVNGKIMIADGIGSLLFFDINTGYITNVINYTGVSNFIPINVFVESGVVYVVSNDARIYVIK